MNEADNNAEPSEFNDLKEVVALAAYIEQLHSCEQQWIMNRLSWLFTSQSFLLTAFVLLLNANNPKPSARLLLFGLPILGIICCITVGLAVFAAEFEGKLLADQRAELSKYINNNISVINSSVIVPMIGVSKGLRTHPLTHWLGLLPHRFLPWFFALLWLALLLSNYAT
jgi:hypothetical protein